MSVANSCRLLHEAKRGKKDKESFPHLAEERDGLRFVIVREAIFRWPCEQAGVTTSGMCETCRRMLNPVLPKSKPGPHG
jgi:hypothetical protein